MTRAEKGTVYLVGAGPGDPELLTLRALRLLESADVVFHDDLVPEEILALVHAQALVMSVGKRCGRPRVTQAGIHALLIESARTGQSVVRLKNGDPLVFGRAGEEIAALRAADVPFEIVPGVTAALAAGAVLGLPLTDRKSASKLIFVTGHHATGKDETPIWSGPLPEDATMVIYMPDATRRGSRGSWLRRVYRRICRAARSRMPLRRGRAMHLAACGDLRSWRAGQRRCWCWWGGQWSRWWRRKTRPALLMEALEATTGQKRQNCQHRIGDCQ